MAAVEEEMKRLLLWALPLCMSVCLPHRSSCIKGFYERRGGLRQISGSVERGGAES